MNNCKHEGETGEVCSKCGEKLIDKRLLPMIAIGMTLFIVVIAVLFQGKNQGCSSPAPQRTPSRIAEVTTRTVKYSVTGKAFSVSITMSNASGGTEQSEIEILPWSKTFKCENGTFLYLAAQNRGESGTVSASIYVDGELFKNSKSSGGYTIASVSGVAE